MSELGVVVECIECGHEVCVHQQAVIRRFEAERDALRAEVERLTNTVHRAATESDRTQVGEKSCRHSPGSSSKVNRHAR